MTILGFRPAPHAVFIVTASCHCRKKLHGALRAGERLHCSDCRDFVSWGSDQQGLYIETGVEVGHRERARLPLKLEE